MASYHKTFDYVNVNVQYGKSPVRISAGYWGNSDEDITDRPMLTIVHSQRKSHQKEKKYKNCIKENGE
jgi:hypothetical protein